MAGQAKWYERCLDACATEAMACRDALGLAQQCGVQKLHLETDCLELVQLWEKREEQRSAIYPVLMEIKDLSLVFFDFLFTFASRNCNKVAHVLTRQVTSIETSGVWHETPDCVRVLLESECNPGHI